MAKRAPKRRHRGQPALGKPLNANEVEAKHKVMEWLRSRKLPDHLDVMRRLDSGLSWPEVWREIQREKMCQ